VTLQVELAATLWMTELPPAIDERVSQAARSW
jgi:hypothetical protein